mmetsp:Transcript_7294/g.8328  ORF Transcript_7294/g.8328 Transcript_7294/m.8328 type:complete len:627 (-) Transcript_7294:172-2052(-)
MSDYDQYNAMVEFIGCFPSISGPPPSDLKELSDGVVMFEALSEISHEYFDPSTIARDLGSNWALKANNLRKLLRNLETYFNEVLHKTANFEEMANSISSIARSNDVEAIVAFVELITAAAVTCPDKRKYVGWIMNMSSDNQIQMKSIIQFSISRLQNYNDEENNGFHSSLEKGSEVDDDDDNLGLMSEEEDNMLSDEDFEGEAAMSGLFRNAMSQLDSATQGMDVTFDTEQSGSLSMPMDVVRERDGLRTSLVEARRELSAQQTQSARMVEDTESSQRKLRALAEDLQERLEQRQAELLDVEEKLLKTKRSLEDSESKVVDLTEKNATLADELDIANAKAFQLRKAEATVVAYRKKLEGVGVMNQQMTDLEDQSAKYLGKIMDLEMETKKVPDLQKNLDEVKRELVRVQKEKVEATENISIKTAELSKLKSELHSSVTAKKMFEEELNELRSLHQSQSKEEVEYPEIAALSLTSAKSVSEVREKAMRLEIENKNLKKQLGLDVDLAVGASAIVSNRVSDAAVTSLEAEIKDLKFAIKKKEASIIKLSTDKDRLEAYTKKTLSKFQEKYLVALQECKAKLKEKHDKIEQLEVRSATEKSNQKREERLLSSAMYELGLSIMQQKLKER